MPYSQNESELKTKNSDIDSNAYLIDHFSSNGVVVESVDLIDTNLLPSRFGPIHEKAFLLNLKDRSNKYYRWTYPDSIKVMNAFYNWMDCFGRNCESIFIGEERRIHKGSMMILVGDSSLIMIEGEQVDFSNWYGYHDSIGFDPEWNFSIEQRTGQRARWYTYEEDTKLKYERP